MQLTFFKGRGPQQQLQQQPAARVAPSCSLEWDSIRLPWRQGVLIGVVSPEC